MSDGSGWYHGLYDAFCQGDDAAAEAMYYPHEARTKFSRPLLDEGGRLLPPPPPSDPMKAALLEAIFSGHQYSMIPKGWNT